MQDVDLRGHRAEPEPRREVCARLPGAGKGAGSIVQARNRGQTSYHGGGFPLDPGPLGVEAGAGSTEPRSLKEQTIVCVTRNKQDVWGRAREGRRARPLLQMRRNKLIFPSVHSAGVDGEPGPATISLHRKALEDEGDAGDACEAELRMPSRHPRPGPAPGARGASPPRWAWPPTSRLGARRGTEDATLLQSFKTSPRQGEKARASWAWLACAQGPGWRGDPG